MICFVVALPAEANPIIKHYQLRKLNHDNLFAIYQGQDICLIITGVGKTSSAAAVAYLYSLLEKDKHIAWLNIGIAGHQNFELNQGYLAHKITDPASKRAWYPPRITELNVSSHNVTTVETPSSTYPTSDLYEMEASGFYHIASSCSTSEIIQCYKIISDNDKSPAQNVNSKQVKQFVTDHLDKIEQLRSVLSRTALKLDDIHAIPDIYFELTERYHFTQTQQHQLKQLLKNWQALTDEPLVLESNSTKLEGADKVLVELNNMLDHVSIQINDKIAKNI